MVIDWSLVQYFFATAVAAFAGAGAAFYLERLQKKDDEKIKDLASGNRAIFILSQQYNILYSLKNQFIDPFRKDAAAWLNMPAALPRAHDDLRFDIGSLQFFLMTENKNLLGKLLLEEQRFFEALKTLNERSQLHRYQLQPKLDVLKIKQDQCIIETEIEAALGPVLVGGMKTLTNGLIEHTDEGMDGIKEIYNEMKTQLEKIFPGKKIIKLEFTKAEKPTSPLKNK